MAHGKQETRPESHQPGLLRAASHAGHRQHHIGN